MFDNSQNIDVSSLQHLAAGQYVTEWVVVVRWADRHVGQGGEVSVIPSIVQGDGGVAFSGTQLVLATERV